MEEENKKTSKVVEFIDAINLDDKDLIIISLTIIACLSGIVAFNPASAEIVKMISSGLLGMAIGRKKK